MKLSKPQQYPKIKSRTHRWAWRSFTPSEMACPHCGEIYDWPEFMTRLQAARDRNGNPFVINSAHRCGLHNARVGGAPLSQHLKLAVDISLKGHDRHILYQNCKEAGFTGFGFYTSFLHVDLGRRRHWFGNQKAKQLWQIY
ncbi:MAG: hypothetical protein COA43_03180 [Robiginitomaculum sp.]|nr:MAG: hypothetical protein COA43_03180 [Robiginitomaculum sp.]